jgi:hypothetical protein
MCFLKGPYLIPDAGVPVWLGSCNWGLYRTVFNMFLAEGLTW